MLSKRANKYIFKKHLNFKLFKNHEFVDTLKLIGWIGHACDFWLITATVVPSRYQNYNLRNSRRFLINFDYEYNLFS